MGCDDTKVTWSSEEEVLEGTGLGAGRLVGRQLQLSDEGQNQEEGSGDGERAEGRELN